MMIKDSDLQEFQKLYEEAYGEKVTMAEARRMASALVTLYERFADVRLTIARDGAPKQP